MVPTKLPASPLIRPCAIKLRPLCLCDRSYKLYTRLAGTELLSSSTLTAADAAAGYEELTKSQKQASPTKTGRVARNRPASGVPSSRSACCEQARSPISSSDAVSCRLLSTWQT